MSSKVFRFRPGRVTDSHLKEMLRLSELPVKKPSAKLSNTLNNPPPLITGLGAGVGSTTSNLFGVAYQSSELR